MVFYIIVFSHAVHKHIAQLNPHSFLQHIIRDDNKEFYELLRLISQDACKGGSTVLLFLYVLLFVVWSGSKEKYFCMPFRVAFSGHLLACTHRVYQPLRSGQLLQGVMYLSNSTFRILNVKCSIQVLFVYMFWVQYSSFQGCVLVHQIISKS